MTSRPPSEPAGLYVHLPFCRRKCLYCNFATAPLSARVPAYLDAVLQEARRAAAEPDAPWGTGFDTVYLGGGTPSLLPPERIAALLGELARIFPLAPGSEITLESNPEDVTPASAAAWRAAGVNRVTVGIQTIHAETLEVMRRPGGPEAASAAVDALLAAGIGNVAVDLIAGLPGEKPGQWSESLDFALSLGPRHLSLYLLEVEDKSIVDRRVRDGRWRLPAEDDLAEFYLAARDRLESAGLRQYEISNFARPGCESRHNLKYWRLAPYLGLGLGAHSFDGRRRRWNEPGLKAYLAAVREGRIPAAGGEPEDPAERAREFLLLGLRQTAGVSQAEARERAGETTFRRWRGRMQNFVVDGLVLDDNAVLRLTPRGMLLSNEIFQALFDPEPQTPSSHSHSFLPSPGPENLPKTRLKQG